MAQILHILRDETAIELWEEMRRLDAEIRGLFGLDHEFIDHDLSLGTRIKNTR